MPTDPCTPDRPFADREEALRFLLTLPTDRTERFAKCAAHTTSAALGDAIMAKSYRVGALRAIYPHTSGASGSYVLHRCVAPIGSTSIPRAAVRLMELHGPILRQRVCTAEPVFTIANAIAHAPTVQDFARRITDLSSGWMCAFDALDGAHGGEPDISVYAALDPTGEVALNMDLTRSRRLAMMAALRRYLLKAAAPDNR